MAIPIKSTALGFLEKAASVPSTHQRPRSVPQAAFADALWVVFSAHKLLGQDSENRGKSHQTTIENSATDIFKFLAPIEIMENIGHDYEEYESIASRLSAKTAIGKKAGAEGGGLIQTGKELFSSFSKPSVENITNAVNRGVGGAKVAYHKFDAALVYSSTPRREYQFMFNLIDEGNPRLDIVDPIKRLLRYSSPSIVADTGGDVLPPYAFKLRTEPGNMILMPRCVITAVQPTYRGPYRDGYPSHCELTISFKDLDPLYAGAEGLAASEVLNVTSTLKKYIPGYDKAKKFQSVADRVAGSVTEYDLKHGTSESGNIIDKGKEYIGKI